MCTIYGPRILGKIELPAPPVSKYSRCEECGKRSHMMCMTNSVYIRDNGRQLCDQCNDWEEMAENDTARSIFDSHEDISEYDYWDGDASECE